MMNPGIYSLMVAFLIFNCTSNDMQVMQEKTLTDKFEDYMIKNLKFPERPQRYGVIKTLHYKINVHGEKAISDFERIDSIPKSAEYDAHELSINATGIGEPGKLKPEYDKYFIEEVEGKARKFSRYKKSSSDPFETVYFSFVFQYR